MTARRSRMMPICLALAACSPGTPMPDGGTCAAAKTPPNLVKNGSFECGSGSEWSAQYGDLAVVSGGHASDHAAQLTADSSGAGQLGYTTEVVKGTSGHAYCVNAWVRGTATDMRLEVLATVGGNVTSFASPVQSGWLQAPPTTNLKVTAAAGDSLYLRFKIQNGQAGQTLLVDDVDLWESSSGTCDERH